MQSHEQIDDFTGDKMGSVGHFATFGHSTRPSYGGLRDRQGASMPPINTSRVNQNMASGDLQTPGTGYDMSFSALLPSQLLVGSPFASSTPQFQNFSNYQSPAMPRASQSFNNSLGHTQHHQQHYPHNQQQQPQQHPIPSMLPGMNLGAGMSGGLAFDNSHSNQAHQFTYNNLMTLPFASAMQQQQPQIMSGNSRTVYLGNIPADTPAEEILNHVRSGQIESVRLLPEKNCAFISFLDNSSAVHFHSDAILKKLAIRGQDIKVGWGKPSQVPSSVALAIQQSGASRNVYLGNVPADMTEAEIRADLSKFGPIDAVKLVREKSIGFVHFLSISNAVKAVTQLPQEQNWQPPKKVFYGKDRCAYVSKTQQQNAAQYLGIAPGYAQVLNTADRDLISQALAQQSVAAAAVATAAGGVNNLGNRTVYLGNIHPETTAEEICNVVRGGLLHHVRYIPDKHICFVTFIDPTSAATFFALSNVQGLMIHNRRLKIGWGKHSGALPQAIALAVSGGASRNVYIGNIDETWSEDRLRQDFSDYGDIELINTLREKSCAFVNFTNIANAIKAIEGIRGKEDYKRFKINFGKDRCGNPPRQSNHGAGHNNHNHNAHMNGAGPFGQSLHDGFTSPPPQIEFGLNPDYRADSSGSGFSNAAGHGGSNQRHMQGNNNPLTQYLTQISQGQQSSLTHSNGSISPDKMGQQNDYLGASQSEMDPSPSIGSFGGMSNAQHYTHHGSSNSFTVGSSNPQGSGEAGGYLSASSGMTPTQKSQHSRALSMPAFSQIAPPSSHHSQQSAGRIGALVTGLGGLGLGSNTNGYSGSEVMGLPRWEEEVS